MIPSRCQVFFLLLHLASIMQDLLVCLLMLMLLAGTSCQHSCNHAQGQQFSASEFQALPLVTQAGNSLESMPCLQHSVEICAFESIN